MIERLKAETLKFDAFLNEPPGYEDKRMVRDYRHEAYRHWEKLCLIQQEAISALEAQEAAITELETTMQRIEKRISAIEPPAPPKVEQEG